MSTDTTPAPVGGTVTPPAHADLRPNEFPALFMAADTVSRSGQEMFVRLSRIELVLLILAAGLGAAISFAGIVGDRVLAASVAILLLASAVIRSITRSTDAASRWFEGRAVAESVKTLAWKYMTHVDPLNVKEPRADDRFTELLEEVMGEHVTLAIRQELTTDEPLEQITPAMREVRNLPFEQRRTTYLEHRVRDQIRWYSRRSSEHKRNSDIWFVVGIISEMAALAYAVVLVVTPTWPNLIGLFSTFAAASATLARLRGDVEVSQRYAMAAQELAMIQHRIETSTETTFPDRVVEAEAAISREHKMWAAKRG